MGTALLQPAKAQIDLTLSEWTKQRMISSSAGKNRTNQVTDGPIRRDLPQAISVASFRTTTGHNYFAAHWSGELLEMPAV